MSGTFGVIVIMGLLIAIIAVTLWLWSSVSIIKNKRSNKLVWLLSVMVLPIVGPLAYLVKGKEKIIA